MRLGKVCFDISYVVDLDNERMVEEAKEAIREDLASCIKCGFEGYIKIDNKVDEFVTENDIPDFLKEEEEDE